MTYAGMLCLYHRPTGVICLETDLFEDEERLPALLNDLLESSLCWHWNSVRRFAPQPAYVSLALPASRDWTLLRTDLIDTLLADFTELDGNDDRRSVIMAAADSALVETLRTVDGERQMISAFVQELPPLRLVMVQLGDTGSIHLFLPHKPIAPISAILKSWGISPAGVTQRSPYHRLHLARLESLFKLE